MSAAARGAPREGQRVRVTSGAYRGREGRVVYRYPRASVSGYTCSVRLDALPEAARADAGRYGTALAFTDEELEPI